MAFTEVEYQPQRYFNFTYFVATGANGVITESVAPGVKFKVDEIRVHCSSAFASAEDFTVGLVATQGSEHNITLLSQAMNGVLDVLWIADKANALPFLSDDTLSINLSLVSATNVVGINVIGWAVRG
jgi:hypothetical protein